MYEYVYIYLLLIKIFIHNKYVYMIRFQNNNI